MISHILIVLAATATSSAAPPPEQPTVVPAKKKTAEVDPNKIVCRSSTSAGSWIPQRECHSVAEWKQIRGRQNKDSEDAMSRMRTRGGSANPSEF
ncbi:hypothetical protein [Novosphingobium sp. Leaf2]|uniref:hypothetical protein n=1 Tax=Novosphingobium sp. Leaf2 TaxID=1735670 RepID=UPI000B216154|nr:hypothetical protein [Novosphingobium sp. Leaf2]